MVMSNFVKKWKIKFLEKSGDRMVKYGNYFLMVIIGNDRAGCGKIYHLIQYLVIDNYSHLKKTYVNVYSSKKNTKWSQLNSFHSV